MITETVAIATLRSDPANLRVHGIGNIEAIKRSLERFGQQKPIVVSADGVVIAGNGTLAAAVALGWSSISIVRTTLAAQEAAAYAVADNRTAELAEWDSAALVEYVRGIEQSAPDLAAVLGFDEEALVALAKSVSPTNGLTDPDALPESVDAFTKRGDIWILGKHRLMCGDSTDAEAVARLMGGETAQLLHADPPYGMGKEADGVANDNLYADKLDKFQMAWWSAFRPMLEDNASAYIWGNAPDLWRLVYRGGLMESERLTMRNEIVWQKGGRQGVLSDTNRMYPTATERCIFFMLGEQGFNSNAVNYWDGWEPIRAYLEGEMKRIGWTLNDLNRITGTQMGSHWVTKSQWSFITAEHYAKIRTAARDHDAFRRDHDALRRDHDALRRDFYATRAYFDNTHDAMDDVWEFPIVRGECRHGHPTPKPVAMIGRALRSSLPSGGLCVEPFSGSGTTIMAAETTGRRCYAMELLPQYCDTTIRRWERFTGQTATRA